MKLRLGTLCLFSWLTLTTAVQAQDVPQPTEAGKSAYEQLLGKCFATKALTLDRSQPDAPQLTVTDADQLTAVAKEQAANWTPDLRDALIANTANVSTRMKPGLAALLRLCGEQAKDDLAIGVAAYHEGLTLESDNKLADAFARYEAAEKLCAKSKSLTWQGACQNRMGTTRMSEKRYEEALKLLQTGLSLRREHGGDEHIDVSHSLNNLGVVLSHLKRYDEAVKHHEEALTIRRKVLGEKHYYIVQSLTSLSDVNRDRGDHPSKLKYLTQLLAAQKLLKGDTHFELTTTYYRIGNHFYNAKSYQEAEDHCRPALALIIERATAKSLAATLMSLEIADCRRALKDFPAAIKQYEAILVTLQEIDQIRSKSTVRCWQGIGDCQNQLRQLAEARDSTNRALQVQVQLAGPKHSDLTALYVQLAYIEKSQNKIPAALEALRLALEIEEANSGKSPFAASLLNSVGSFHYDAAQYAEAEKVFAECLQRRRQLHGDKHATVAELLVQLGNCRRQRAKYAEAIKSYEEALELHRTLDGEKHATVAMRLQDIASCYSRSNKLAPARQHLLRALEMQTETAVRPDPLMGRLLIDLGYLERAGEDFAKSEGYFKQALEIRIAQHGEDHADVAYVYRSLASLETSRSQIDAAVRYYEKALAIGRKAGIDFEIASSLGSLADLDRQRGKFAAALDKQAEAITVFTRLYGERSEQLATALEDRGDIYHSAERYREALADHQRVLAMRRELFGDGHANVANSYADIGDELRDLGNFAGAKENYQHALRIRQNLFGKESVEAANSIRSLGHVYWNQAQVPAALEYYQQALAIKQKVLAEPHAEVATLLIDIADAHRRAADFANALTYYQRALQMRRQLFGENHRDVANALFSLGELHAAKSEFEVAKERLQEALSIRKVVFGAESKPVAGCLNEIGLTAVRQGNYQESIPLHLEALRIFRKIGAATDWTEYQLGYCYEWSADYHKAADFYEKAMKTREATLPEAHPRTMVAQIALARVQLHFDRSQAMINFFRHTKDPDHVAFPHESALIHSGRAAYWYHLGIYSRAAREYETAVKVGRRALGERHPDVAFNLHGLASSYSENRDFVLAERAFRECLEFERATLGKQHANIAGTLFEFARMYSEQGKYAEALALASEGVEMLRVPTGASARRADKYVRTPLAARLLRYRAWVYKESILASGDRTQWQQAREYYRDAAEINDAVRGGVIQSEGSKLLLATDNNGILGGRLRVGLKLFELEGDPAHLEEAFLACEQGFGRVFLESLGKARALQAGGVNEELRKQERGIVAELQRTEREIQQQSSLPLEKRNSPLLSELLSKQAAGDQQLQALITKLEQDYPQYAALKYPQPCTLQEARDALRPNEVALIYVMYSDGAYLVLLDKDPAADPQTRGCGVYALTAGNRLAELTEALTDPRALSQPRRSASVRAELYRELLGPVAHKIAGKDLVIVPSAGLCNLPFELLAVPPAEAGGTSRYLIEVHNVRYAPSLTALHLTRLWDKSRSKPKTQLWAIGDPIYDRADPRANAPEPVTPEPVLDERLASIMRSEGLGPEAFPRLEFSAAELRAIANTVGEGSSRLLLGNEASESSVKKASESGELAAARFVHFATHGTLGSNLGRSQSLVLNLVGNDQEDGFLQLDEVTSLHLNADAVVLSACSTGRGKLHNGEGLRGLSRAFLFAGSRSVVCSLWQVEDQATAQVMAEFYQQLQNGHPTDVALRRAKLKMLEAGQPPLYWAPFVMMGVGEATSSDN